MKSEQLSIFALGGLNEIGKNMYAIQYSDEILIIDCGIKFPDESLLGVDGIIPDITYLQDNKDKIRGLLVTHGHEDHIGGIPYLLKQLNLPVYGSRLTLGLIEIKLKEHNLLAEASLVEIDSETKLDFEYIHVSFFKTNHSIPDCVGMVFDTPEGCVVHTGDFKFDLIPINNQPPDLHKMAQIGSRGVLALLSESTNAEKPGFTPSERIVGEHLMEAFIQARGKVFVSTFASNVNRVQQVINAAHFTNRKVALLGRSMVNVVSVAIDQGYLEVPENMLIEPKSMNFY